MSTTPPYRDGLSGLAQVGTTLGVQLVRVTAPKAGNTYYARPVEFDADGVPQFVGDETLTVTNLAEPADSSSLPADTDAVAIDVEGRWIVFVRQAAAGAVLAKVVASLGGASYTVREQACDAAGNFADRAGAADLTARNLAELSLGPGAAVDVGTLVLIVPFAAGGATYWVFDHPVYAKYLD